MSHRQRTGEIRGLRAREGQVEGGRTQAGAGAADQGVARRAGEGHPSARHGHRPHRHAAAEAGGTGRADHRRGAGRRDLRSSGDRGAPCHQGADHRRAPCHQARPGDATSGHLHRVGLVGDHLGRASPCGRHRVRRAAGEDEEAGDHPGGPSLHHPDRASPSAPSAGDRDRRLDCRGPSCREPSREVVAACPGQTDRQGDPVQPFRVGQGHRDQVRQVGSRCAWRAGRRTDQDRRADAGHPPGDGAADRRDRPSSRRDHGDGLPGHWRDRPASCRRTERGRAGSGVKCSSWCSLRVLDSLLSVDVRTLAVGTPPRRGDKPCPKTLG